MPETPSPRRQLPLLTRHTAGRSPMTCLYKCGDACSHPVPNESTNECFGDVVADQVSRRGLLKAGAVGAVVAGIGLTAAPASAAPAAPAAPAVPAGSAARGRSRCPAPR